MAPELIPVANIKARFKAHESVYRAAVDRVLESGWYILGNEVRSFEQEFARFCGVSDCIGVGSGTEAISLALRAMGVKGGDEVLTVSHSAVATVAAIEQIGAVPVFVDIDPIRRCMDPTALARMVSSQTKAVVVVHIYGQPADMQKILSIADDYGLMVLEDCAQAHGAEIMGRKVGSFGAAAAFSFYPTKNLGAMGDGGAVVTNDPRLAEQCRCLREYGWKDRYISSMPGYNSRLDELQAAILRAGLGYLEEENARRREMAHRFTTALLGTGIVAPAEVADTLPAFHLYVVEVADRNDFEAYLASQGIATARHYPAPIHQQPAYQGRIRGGGALPVTELLYDRIVSLPMYPELTNQQVDRIVTVLSSVEGSR